MEETIENCSKKFLSEEESMITKTLNDIKTIIHDVQKNTLSIYSLIHQYWKRLGPLSLRNIQQLLERPGSLLKRNSEQIIRKGRLIKSLKSMHFQKQNQGLQLQIQSSSKKIRKQSLFILQIVKLHQTICWLNSKKEHLIDLASQLLKKIEPKVQNQLYSKELLKTFQKMISFFNKMSQENLFKMTEFQTLFVQNNQMFEINSLIQGNLDLVTNMKDPMSKKHFYELLFVKFILESSRIPTNNKKDSYNLIEKDFQKQINQIQLIKSPQALKLALKMAELPIKNCQFNHCVKKQDSELEQWKRQIIEQQDHEISQKLWFEQMYRNFQSLMYFNYFPQATAYSMIQTEPIENKKVQQTGKGPYDFALDEIDEEVSSYDGISNQK